MGITERRLQVSQVRIRCKTILWGPGVEEDISYCLWLDCMRSSPTSAFCASVRTESTAGKMHNWQHEKKNIHHFSFKTELKESGEKSEGVDVLKVPGEKTCSCKPVCGMIKEACPQTASKMLRNGIAFGTFRSSSCVR